jgi:diaminopimelate epimerase
MLHSISFQKYHGTGNDFIIINGFNLNVSLTEAEIQQMCHRRFGIGADGLIILRNLEGFDFYMDFYNSDGKPGSMCGNGGRCIVAFAHDLGLIKHKTRFKAPDGAHEAIFHHHDKISLKMANVTNIEKHEMGMFMNTGSPHLVLFKDTMDFDVCSKGREIRNNAKYKKEGTNVNFVIADQKHPLIYTYERGVEDETYACGTGAVASALTLNTLKNMESPIQLKAKGGTLTVYFNVLGEANYTDIWLEGPAKKIFSGTYFNE